MGRYRALCSVAQFALVQHLARDPAAARRRRWNARDAGEGTHRGGDRGRGGAARRRHPVRADQRAPAAGDVDVDRAPRRADPDRRLQRRPARGPRDEGHRAAHDPARSSIAPTIELLRAHGLDVWLYQGADWFVQDVDGPHVDREAATVQFAPTLRADYDGLVDGHRQDRRRQRRSRRGSPRRDAPPRSASAITSPPRARSPTTST